MTTINSVVLVHGGELASDVAFQIEKKKPTANASLKVEIRNASEKPKKLLDLGEQTLVCFVIQTIENNQPTEDGGSCIRFFKRKTHPQDLLEGKFSFAVLGVGDSNLLLDRQTTTAQDCNQCAQDLHSRLLALGGKRVVELGLADERTGLTEVEPWIDSFWTSLMES